MKKRNVKYLLILGVVTFICVGCGNEKVDTGVPVQSVVENTSETIETTIPTVEIEETEEVIEEPTEEVEVVEESAEEVQEEETTEPEVEVEEVESEVTEETEEGTEEKEDTKDDAEEQARLEAEEKAKKEAEEKAKAEEEARKKAEYEAALREEEELIAKAEKEHGPQDEGGYDYSKENTYVDENGEEWIIPAIPGYDPNGNYAGSSATAGYVEGQLDTFVALVNAARAERGLNPVVVDPVVQGVSEERAKEISIDYRHVGCIEVMGRANYYVDATVAFEGWKTSPEHWAILMDPEVMDIGFAIYAANGYWYFVSNLL